MAKVPILPALPHLLEQKIDKTGDTRGATDNMIFRNRVRRYGTVLIPYDYWDVASVPPPGEAGFERGFITLLSPRRYFSSSNINEELEPRDLEIGRNTLVFYETRADWLEFNPEQLGWVPAISRRAPLGGQYVARVPATTAADKGGNINRGFTTTKNKGAGIRSYEYASPVTIAACRLQLEALFWLCFDASEVASEQGMSIADIAARKDANRELCANNGLLDIARLVSQRLLSPNGKTICPLCLEEVPARGFFTRVEQAEGRVVPDLTITQLNLFHIEELRLGRYGHRPYNVGWGHHHCNVVVKDSGIDKTLIWMQDVIDKNIEAGYLVPRAKGE